MCVNYTLKRSTQREQHWIEQFRWQGPFVTVSLSGRQQHRSCAPAYLGLYIEQIRLAEGLARGGVAHRFHILFSAGKLRSVKLGKLAYLYVVLCFLRSLYPCGSQGR